MSKRMPDVGEQVEVVFDWARDHRYVGTVETVEPKGLVVHVTSGGAPVEEPRLLVYEWAWSQPGQILALDYVNWRP
jgi:uncharacterized protein YndB with AHSA1/START domain